jgi:hypothetical protein
VSDLELVYDDNLADAMDKVNAALAKHGLRFEDDGLPLEDDGLPLDGFMLYDLKRTGDGPAERLLKLLLNETRIAGADDDRLGGSARVIAGEARKLLEGKP